MIDCIANIPLQMEIKNHSFRYCESKYNPSSIPILLAYGLQYCFEDSNKYKLLITPSVHIYNLCRSLYDRFYDFPYRGEKILKFIRNDYYDEDREYHFKTINKDYGMSLIDIISLIGIISTLSKVYDFKEYTKLQYAVLGLTLFHMISGSPSAAVEIEYEHVNSFAVEIEDVSSFIIVEDAF